MLRKILVAAVLILLAAFAALTWATRPLPILTVTTWAGDYGRAQAAAQMHPYAGAKRVDVRLAEWDGELSGLKGDVVDFELPRAVEACRKGLLEKIDAAALPAGSDGSPASRDFVRGAIGPCWVSSIVYSQIIITAPGVPAKTLADFFDTTKFPGKRALKRGSGKYNLEMALLADGVPADQVYATLASDAGVTRALHKLASLGADLIWYDQDSEALGLIRDHRAAFATTLNRTVFDAAQQGQAPGVIWDHQLYELDVFGVPAGDPRKEMAMDYIRFATGSGPLAGGWQAGCLSARRGARPGSWLAGTRIFISTCGHSCPPAISKPHLPWMMPGGWPTGAAWTQRGAQDLPIFHAKGAH